MKANVSSHVRVLWDVENVPLPAHIDAITVLMRFRQWLCQQGLDGGGVDSRITAIYCPGKVGSLFNNSTAHILDRCGVEQIFCSRKIEDADRKIVLRLQQEAIVLPPGTTFVLISGDLDFNTTCGFLVAHSFKVIVICGRNTSTSIQRCFGLNATLVCIWEDIVCTNDKHVDSSEIVKDRVTDIEGEITWDNGASDSDKRKEGSIGSKLYILLSKHVLIIRT